MLDKFKVEESLTTKSEESQAGDLLSAAVVLICAAKYKLKLEEDRVILCRALLLTKDETSGKVLGLDTLLKQLEDKDLKRYCIYL